MNLYDIIHPKKHKVHPNTLKTLLKYTFKKGPNGKHWYTNGIIELKVKEEEAPFGFERRKAADS